MACHFACVWRISTAANETMNKTSHMSRVFIQLKIKNYQSAATTFT